MEIVEHQCHSEQAKNAVDAPEEVVVMILMIDDVTASKSGHGGADGMPSARRSENGRDLSQ
jgi:hypothetical protein